MRLKSFVLIEKDGRYLLIQEAAPKWDKKWFMPGGSLKKNETLEMGAKREVMEEAGCAVELTHVFYVKHSQSFFNKKVSVFFSGKILGDKIKTVADEESLDVRWFSYEELAQLPQRQNLKELVTIYRTYTGFIPAADFRL